MPSSVYGIRMEDDEQMMVLDFCCQRFRTCGKLTERRIPASDPYNIYGTLAICEQKDCPRKEKDTKYEIGELHDGSKIYLRRLTPYRA